MRFVSASLFVVALTSSVCAETGSPGGTVRMLVQSSPLAGSQYYRFDKLNKEIKVGDALELIRESANPHDRNAVSVRWRGEPLGYLPRKENRAVAKAMDDGETVKASVETISNDLDPWKRLRISVFIEL